MYDQVKIENAHFCNFKLHMSAGATFFPLTFKELDRFLQNIESCRENKMYINALLYIKALQICSEVSSMQGLNVICVQLP